MYEGEPWMDKVHSDYSSRMELQGIAEVISDKTAVEKVITIIMELHKSGVDEVAFAMRHLPQGRCIRTVSKGI